MIHFAIIHLYSSIEYIMDNSLRLHTPRV